MYELYLFFFLLGLLTGILLVLLVLLGLASKRG